MELMLSVVTVFALLLPRSQFDYTQHPGAIVLAMLSLCGLLFAAIEIGRAGRVAEREQQIHEPV